MSCYVVLILELSIILTNDFPKEENSVSFHLRITLTFYLIAFVLKDVCNLDFDELVESISCDKEKRAKLRKSVSLLRSFDGIPNEFLCPISMEIMAGKQT